MICIVNHSNEDSWLKDKMFICTFIIYKKIYVYHIYLYYITYSKHIPHIPRLVIRKIQIPLRSICERIELIRNITNLEPLKKKEDIG